METPTRRSFFARMFAPAASAVSGAAIVQIIKPSDDDLSPEERHRRAIEEMTAAEFEMLAARGPETERTRETMAIAEELEAERDIDAEKHGCVRMGE